jgi:hypothetical protein
MLICQQYRIEPILTYLFPTAGFGGQVLPAGLPIFVGKNINMQ